MDWTLFYVMFLNLKAVVNHCAKKRFWAKFDNNFVIYDSHIFILTKNVYICLQNNIIRNILEQKILDRNLMKHFDDQKAIDGWKKNYKFEVFPNVKP